MVLDERLEEELVASIGSSTMLKVIRLHVMVRLPSGKAGSRELYTVASNLRRVFLQGLQLCSTFSTATRKLAMWGSLKLRQHCKTAARAVSGFYPLIASQPPTRLAPPECYLPSFLSLSSFAASRSLPGHQDHRWMRAAVAVVAVALSVAFELETASTTVECVQCVQLWKSSSAKESKACGSNAKTCTGDACFMRQCKYCPVYQYMFGCVSLSSWQLADLEANRRAGELRMRRVGAELLCEDSFNQTTCICNRRDKCNSIHSRLPYSTYADGLFKGVIDFDKVIGDLDPRYLEVISGYITRFSQCSSGLQLAGIFILPFFLFL